MHVNKKKSNSTKQNVICYHNRNMITKTPNSNQSQFKRRKRKCKRKRALKYSRFFTINSLFGNSFHSTPLHSTCSFPINCVINLFPFLKKLGKLLFKTVIDEYQVCCMHNIIHSSNLPRRNRIVHTQKKNTIKKVSSAPSLSLSVSLSLAEDVIYLFIQFRH